MSRAGGVAEISKVDEAWRGEIDDPVGGDANLGQVVVSSPEQQRGLGTFEAGSRERDKDPQGSEHGLDLSQRSLG